jgi:DNA-binding transcriptional LysR family regulator
VIIEGTGNEPRRQPHADSQRYLAVNTVEAAIEAVRSGVCFGWLPVYRIKEYLDSGELVGLQLPLGGERFARMHLIMRDLNPSSKEKAYLADLLGAKGELEVI